MGVGKILGLGGSKYRPLPGGVGRQAGTQKCLGGTPPGSVKKKPDTHPIPSSLVRISLTFLGIYPLTHLSNRLCIFNKPGFRIGPR